jgi:hypothetical protein
MRVEGNRPIRPATARQSDKTGGSGAFAEVLGGDSVSAPATAAPLGGISALFALQEVADSTGQRRKAMARANHILDRLGDVQIGLLTGVIDRNSLADLAASARGLRGTTDDARLQGILDEIELRAAVELAKLSSAS